MTPVQFLMKHRALILPIHKEQGSIPKTYKKLLSVLPEIKNIKQNTFKQYMPRLIEIAERIDYETKVLSQEKAKIENDLRKKDGKLKTLLQENIKLEKAVREKDHTIIELKSKNKPLDDPVEKVDGWNIVKGKDGYFRVNRKIKGKVISVHIGKQFNIQKARNKIQVKLRKLMINY
ncbi:hypothetical protein MHK_005175 [Candidatus Magnetomorum sp. HK-1]|nr:hypothetical protein MHK_005175 [Candidatus Magnetomorum sp. HK-1]